MPHRDVTALLEHADFLRRLVRGLVGDPATAEDLAQDTWVAALRDAPSDVRSPRAWLATVARRLAGKQRRGDERRRRREQAAARPEATRDKRLDPLLIETISVALATLPADEREAIVMRYYEGLSPKEIAVRLSAPRNTIRSRLQRGLARIRARLDTTGDRASWSVALTAWAFPARRRTPVLLGLAGAATVVIAGLFVWQGGRPGPAVRTTDIEPSRISAGALARSDPPAEPTIEPLPAAASVRGEVVARATGTPRAGATVRLVALGWRQLSLGNGWPSRPLAPRTLGEVRTDARGRFVLPLAPGAGAEVVVEGLRRRCRAGDRLRVTVPERETVHGTVTGPDGAPLAGVLVRTDHEQLGETDEQGAFSFELLPAAGLTFEYPDLVSVFAQSEEPGEPLDIRMRRSWTVRGTVYDVVTAQPIPNAIVGDGDHTVKTDGAGQYELRGPSTVDRDESPRREQSIAAWAEGYVTADRDVRPDEGPMDLWLARGDTVTGIVLDQERQPVAGALVATIAVGSFRSVRSTADANGAFRLAGVMRSPKRFLVVLAPGRGRWTQELPPPGSVPGRVALGAVVLGTRCEITGVARDRKGRPIANDYVSVKGPEHVVSTTMTDVTGRFRFAALAPGRYVVTAGRREVEATVTLSPKAPHRKVTLRTPAPRFTVLVTDRDGRPVHGAEVRTGGGFVRTDRNGKARLPDGSAFRVTANGFLPRRIGSVKGGSAHVRLSPGAVTTVLLLDEQGKPVETYLDATTPDGWSGAVHSYEFDDGLGEFVAPTGQTVTLELEAGDFQAATFRVAAGSQRTVLRLRRTARNRSLTVRVMSPDGSPGRGRKVVLNGLDYVQAVTGIDGRAVFPKLLPVRYDIAVEGLGPGLLAVEIEDIEARGQEVTMRIRRTARLTGRIVDAAGRGLDNTLLRLATKKEEFPHGRADKNGLFTLVYPIDETLPLRLKAWHERRRRRLERAVEPGPDLVVVWR